MMCVITSNVSPLKLVIATHCSSRVSERVLIHDCSPYVNQILRGYCKWVRSVTRHLPRIKAATNDLVVQGRPRGVEFNMPMLVQTSRTCNEQHKQCWSKQYRPNLADCTKYQDSWTLMNLCCDSVVQQPSHVSESAVHACADG